MATDHPQSQQTLPEPSQITLREIRERPTKLSKLVITEERFLDGVRRGFEPSEIAHLTDAQQDNLALSIANNARQQWNAARQAEIMSAKSIENESTQNAMADEL